MSMSELTREQSQRVRERYQQLEELARPQRPVMVSSLRSFSYDMPTQHAEVERMMRARSNSPAPAPAPAPAPGPLSIPLADSPPPLSRSQLAAASPRLAILALPEGLQQQGPTQQHECVEQTMTEQDTHKHQGEQEVQQSPKQLDTQSRRDSSSHEPLSSENSAV